MYQAIPGLTQPRNRSVVVASGEAACRNGSQFFVVRAPRFIGLGGEAAQAKP